MAESGQLDPRKFAALSGIWKCHGDQQHDPSIHFDWRVDGYTDAGRAKMNVQRKGALCNFSRHIGSYLNCGHFLGFLWSTRRFVIALHSPTSSEEPHCVSDRQRKTRQSCPTAFGGSLSLVPFEGANRGIRAISCDL